MLVKCVCLVLTTFIIISTALLIYYLIWLPENSKQESSEEDSGEDEEKGENEMEVKKEKKHTKKGEHKEEEHHHHIDKEKEEEKKHLEDEDHKKEKEHMKEVKKSHLVDNREEMFGNLLQYILHPKTPCMNSVILGGILSDGGKLLGSKTICLNPGLSLREGCRVFSFGVNNWSFEEYVQRSFHCQVFAYDPTLKQMDYRHADEIWFYNRGIANFNGDIIKNNETMTVNTFSSITSSLGLVDPIIDVVQMDIGGDEFAVLEDMLERGDLKRVNHLCVNLHLTKQRYWEEILDLLQRIEEEGGLRLFSTKNKTEHLQQVVGLPHRQEQITFETSWFRHSNATLNFL